MVPARRIHPKSCTVNKVPYLTLPFNRNFSLTNSQSLCPCSVRRTYRDRMTDFLTPSVIGYLAGGSLVLAYLIINQIALRIIVIIGTGFYIWYYFVAAPTPLWEAIYLSVAMGLANIFGLLLLFARKSRFAIPPQHADIYSSFSALPPGDFRDLMKLATRRFVVTREQISQEDGDLTHLTYVISGRMEVEKHGDRFRLALEAMISKDLAAKVSIAVAPNSAAWRDLAEPACTNP